MIHTIRFPLALALVTSGLLVACGDDPTPTVVPSDPLGQKDVGSPADTGQTDDTAQRAPDDGPPAGCKTDDDCDSAAPPPCQKVVCKPDTGQCALESEPGGSDCELGDACQTGSTCKAGKCTAGVPVSCDDSDDCTKDGCQAASGCTHEPIDGCGCVPACEGPDGKKECGGDGCGGTCGACEATELCVDGLCEEAECVPKCGDAECGDDGCGGSCGKCKDGHVCDEGTCSDAPCTPECGDKECGSDGCGGKCGECNEGDICNPGGKCVEAPCVPACSGKECGDDGCGGKCGVCKAGFDCEAGGKCVEAPCVPNCKDKECGFDGCDGSCGTCKEGELCTVIQQCVAETCVPDCAGKSCGDDGCGGLCGSCTGGDLCLEALCIDGSCQMSPIEAMCDDADPCTDDDQCTGGTCKGTPKEGDGYEPNNAWIGEGIGEVTDCGTMDTLIVASLMPAGDEDWFWYSLTDSPICDTQPQVKLVPPEGANFDVCAYFSCVEGTPSATCQEGSYAVDDGPPGTVGCCSSNPGDDEDLVRMNAGCGAFTANDGYVDVHVFPASGEEKSCANYVLWWGES